MKILVINSTYRSKGTTKELSKSFINGAKSRGAKVEMIMLHNKNIKYCTNCLKCYAFIGDGLSPCSLKDDMDDIIVKVSESDGILFASPVHNGFVTGLMTVFWERIVWLVGRATSPVVNCMSLQSRINDRVRALASIVSAGGMPERLRRFCDGGTPWLKENATLMLHGQWIGDMYAGADLKRIPQNNKDWEQLYFLRQLSNRQHKQAYILGCSMADAIDKGKLKAITMENMFHPMLRWSMELLFKLSPNYRVAGDTLHKTSFK